MAAARRKPTKDRTSEMRKQPAQTRPGAIVDTNALLQWFDAFDARMAALTARQDALLRDLGVEPVRQTIVPESLRQAR
ncbi:MAG TPA: hypothetical protein VGG99_15305 [Acetobacteraceae bacterium]|jgi:hypothetical protein